MTPEMNWIRIVAAGTIAAIITVAAAVTHGAVAIAGPAILAPFKTSDTTVSLLIKQELDSRKEVANQNKEISNTGTEDNHAKASKQTVKIHEQAASGILWENRLGKSKVVRDAIQKSKKIINDLVEVIRKETGELSVNYDKLNNSSSGNKRLSAKISAIEEKREAALKALKRYDSKEAANMRAYIDSSNSTTKRNA